MLETLKIPIIVPELGDDEADAARDVVLSGWVTQGPQVTAFEKEFAGAVGAPLACAVSNCTAALHLALLAVGVGPGSEVITASHSFIATTNAIRHCGAFPVFVDIDRDTFNIDPAQIEEAVGPKTSAILCVHQMGMPCDMRAIQCVARAHGLPVVEDAACAAGSAVRGEDGLWQPIGTPIGDAVCFSFHPRKVITTGDGGMITSATAEHDRHYRLWRQHGMSVSDAVRHGSSQVVFETYPVTGFNYRMTDIQAAVGRVQLRRLGGIVERRRAIAARYRQLLGDIEGLKLPFEPAWARSNWQSFCVGLPECFDQRQVMQAMLDAGVATRRGIMCAHREPAYADLQPRHDLTKSEQAQDTSIILPLYSRMSEADIECVADNLRNVLHKSGGS
jgi:perosamine synthetase